MRMNQECFDFIQKELEEADALCDTLGEERIAVKDIRKVRPESVLLKIANLYGMRFQALMYDPDKAVRIAEKAMEFHSGREEHPSREDLNGYKRTYLQDFLC